MVRFTLTLREFIAALERAARDDHQYRGLDAYDWLLSRATVSDERVTIDTGVQLAPGQAMDH